MALTASKILPQQFWDTSELITAEKMNKIFSTLNNIIDSLDTLEEQVGSVESYMEEHNTTIEEGELGLRIIYKS